jgi:hypothetical protein
VEALIIVNTDSLDEDVRNPTSLVPFQGAIKIELVHENPLIGDDVVANGVRDKIPGVVGDQGSKFFFHGMAPIRIDEGDTDGGGHQQQGRC